MAHISGRLRALRGDQRLLRIAAQTQQAAGYVLLTQPTPKEAASPHRAAGLARPAAPLPESAGRHRPHLAKGFFTRVLPLSIAPSETNLGSG